jgi:membrane-bound lytic murein transglycosylase D
MKKLFVCILLLTGALLAKAAITKDTLVSGQTITLTQDNPEMQEIDRILVNSYLNHFCFSADQELLNAYGYSPEQVPAFSQEVMEQRMKALDKETPFHLIYNTTVQGFIDLYAVRRRDITTKVLGMSQLYFPLFEECLAKHGIPLEMKYLAIVESALNPVAISSAGAGGLWQFMVGTGKMYGLDVNSYQDERFDAYKATDAACRYLKFLYNTFGNWELALAAYNSGPGNVNKAIRRSGGKKDFWAIKPYLPKETQGYVPAFIAVNYVMNYASEHNIYPKKPLTTFFETDTVGVSKRVDFVALSQLLNLPVEDISFLNGTYKLKEIPDNGRRHYLVLPVSKIGLFLSNEELVYQKSEVRIEEEPLVAKLTDKDNQGETKTFWEDLWVTHKVRKGESLRGISDKYDVSASQIKKWNRIRGSKVAAGQKLKIQTRVKRTVPTEATAKPEDNTADNTKEKIDSDQDKAKAQQEITAKSAQATENKIVKAEKAKYYTVQPGDTLWKIASNKGVSVDQIKKLNKGLRENKLTVGQKIILKKAS